MDRTPLSRVFFVALATLVIAAPAGAELGDILHTIPTPGDNPADLAWVEGELYSVIFAPTEQRGIYRLDPQTGSVLGMVPYAGTMPQGLTYDGHNLWQVCITSDCYFKMHPVSGAIYDTFPAPGGPDGQPIGLGWDGASLWLADSRSPEKIWQLDTLGVTLGQIPAPGASPYGLAWACGYIWVSDNSTGGLGYIYKLDPATGGVVAFFPCPGGGGSPNGIAHDGENLWIAVNTTDTIYEVDDGMAGAGIHEAEAAWQPQLRLLAARFRGDGIALRLELGRTSDVRVELLDLLGRSCSRWHLAALAGGPHELHLGGARPASGRYWIRLRAAGERQVRGIWIAR